jgi:hypothetical protein
MSDDIVGNFCAVTGLEEGAALQYLSATEFNLEEAVNLFFAGVTVEQLSGQQQPTRPPQPPVAGSSTTTNGPTPNQPQPQRKEPRAQETPPSVDIDVPPKSRQKTETLVTQPYYSAFVPMSKPHGEKKVRGPEAEADASSALEAQFRMPTWALSGVLRPAADWAVHEKRYLLLNILDPKQWASKTFNRMWNDPITASTTQAYFVLYVVQTNTDIGKSLLLTYNVTELPHLAVLDPCSRAELKRFPTQRLLKDNTVAADRVSDMLVDFVDRKGPFTPPTFSSTPQPAPLPTKPTAVSTSAGAGAGAGAGSSPQVSSTIHSADPSHSSANALQALPTPPPPTTSPHLGSSSPSPSTALEPFILNSPEQSIGLKLRFKLRSGPWDVCLKPSTPCELLLAAVAEKLSLSASEVELKSGFPMKTIEIRPGMTLADTTVRTGDLITPHVK